MSSWISGHSRARRWYGRVGALFSCLAGLSAAISSAAPWTHEDESYNFVWGNDPTHETYRPDETYTHHAAGGVTVVERESVGRYRVRWSGSTLSEDGAVALVTAYGFGNEYCKIHEPPLPPSQDEVVVACYDAGGSPADTQFSAVVVGPHIRPTSYAFAHADQPNNPNYFVTGWAGIESSSIEITRSSAGIYRVDFPGFSGLVSTGGNVQVTAYGADNRRCTVVSWGVDYTNVRCFNASGTLADTAFGVHFQREGTRNDSFAYVYAHDSTSASYVPTSTFAYNAAGGQITATRSGAGTYFVDFGGLSTLGVDGGNVQVTAYTSADKRCKIAYWTGGGAAVRCFDTAGNPVDSVYSLIFRKPIRRLLTRNFAIAEVGGVGTPSSFDIWWNAYSDAPYPIGQYNVTRPSTGVYEVEFPNMSKIGSDGGNVQVSAVGEDDNYCKVSSWVFDTITVRCFDPAGVPINEQFQVLWMKPEDTNAEIAYAWFEEPSLPSHVVDLEYAHNPTGGAIEATRMGVGQYRVRFLGIDTVGVNDGGPMVTAYGPGSERCQLVGWNLDFVDVRCYLAGGASLVDSRFSLLWLKPESDARGFVFALADLPTNPASYPPPSSKAYPYGTMIIWPHAGVGGDDVIYNGFAETGVDWWSPYFMVFVSSVGVAGERCGYVGPVVTDWIEVACWNASGVVADSQYISIGVTPIPLPEPAVGIALAIRLSLTDRTATHEQVSAAARRCVRTVHLWRCPRDMKASSLHHGIIRIFKSGAASAPWCQQEFAPIRSLEG